MYQDFCREYPDVVISYVYYYKKVKSLNMLKSLKCDLHEKHLEDCHRLTQVEFCEIDVDGGRDMKIFDGCDDCVKFATHITAATGVRCLYHKEK